MLINKIDELPEIPEWAKEEVRTAPWLDEREKDILDRLMNSPRPSQLKEEEQDQVIDYCEDLKMD